MITEEGSLNCISEEYDDILKKFFFEFKGVNEFDV